MKKLFFPLIASISILAAVACGGSGGTSAEPTAAPAPTATAIPTPTAEPTAAPSADAGVLACLTEALGSSVAQVVASGLISLSDEQSAILGECVLAASTSASAGTADPIVACLEQSLEASLARAVASGAIPLTADQEALLGGCVLSTSLGGATSTLSATVVACLENALGAASAQAVASGSAGLTDEQQAALGGCQLGSALDTSSSTVSTGVMDCLTEELGAEVAQVVASAVLPLSAAEEETLGNCVLLDALSVAP